MLSRNLALPYFHHQFTLILIKRKDDSFYYKHPPILWSSNVLILYTLTTCSNGKKMSCYKNITCYLKNHWTKQACLYSFGCIFHADFLKIPNMGANCNNIGIFENILKVDIVLHSSAMWRVLEPEIWDALNSVL